MLTPRRSQRLKLSVDHQRDSNTNTILNISLDSSFGDHFYDELPDELLSAVDKFEMDYAGRDQIPKLYKENLQPKPINTNKANLPSASVAKKVVDKTGLTKIKSYQSSLLKGNATSTRNSGVRPVPAVNLFKLDPTCSERDLDTSLDLSLTSPRQVSTPLATPPNKLDEREKHCLRAHCGLKRICSQDGVTKTTDTAKSKLLAKILSSSNCSNKEDKLDVSADDGGVEVSGTALHHQIVANSSTGFATQLSHGEHPNRSISLGTPDKLELSSWGLPEPVLKRYHDKGITQMFEWQAQCLCMGKVLEGGNLVYSAPTSAGKTMVAELLMLKRVLEHRRKAIMILPFVSVCREKMFSLQNLFGEAGIKVGGYMGGQSPAGGFSSIDIGICTIEKANSLLNRLLEEDRLSELGMVVVDELHMVGDSHRGYLLELLLTKIRYMTSKPTGTITEKGNSPSIQIVGMSATLPNLDLLAKWLDADLYKTDYRPVPLTECIKFGQDLYGADMMKIASIDTSRKFRGDDDNILPLCLETVRNGHSVLVFCPTKSWCEKLAESIAYEFYKINWQIAKSGAEDVDALLKSDGVPLNVHALRDVCEQLKRTPVGLDSCLGKTVTHGVAFHHAGLTFDERDIIEGAFRHNSLRVLVATSTLSSGVNLPARRVIIRSVMFHGKVLDTLVYRQMSGRAGRKGVDSAGESILICKKNEQSKALSLLRSALPPVRSCLIRSTGEGLSYSMKRAILEIVVSGVATSQEEAWRYARCTMLAASMAQDGNTDPPTAILDCIKFLEDKEFIRLRDDQGCKKFFPTQLGSAILASSLSPDEGLTVFKELQKARRNFVLENELHLIYQVTPTYMQDIAIIDWYKYLCLWEQLSPDMKRVAELVGIQESFLAKAIRGRSAVTNEKQARLAAIHTRFYAAMILNELVDEVPMTKVAHKYNVGKGTLQSLQQNAATFAGMVTVFCHKLGWRSLHLLLSDFQNRLTFGVQQELCDLVRISLLNGHRARVLFNGGYQTVADLAKADPVSIEQLLKNSAPFQSKKQGEHETEWEARQREQSRCIWVTGKKGLTEYEAAREIVEEATSLLQEDLGEMGIQWQPGHGSDKPSCSSPKNPSVSKQRHLGSSQTSAHNTSVQFTEPVVVVTPPHVVKKDKSSQGGGANDSISELCEQRKTKSARGRGQKSAHPISLEKVQAKQDLEDGDACTASDLKASSVSNAQNTNVEIPLSKMSSVFETKVSDNAPVLKTSLSQSSEKNRAGVEHEVDIENKGSRQQSECYLLPQRGGNLETQGRQMSPELYDNVVFNPRERELQNDSRKMNECPPLKTGSESVFKVPTMRSNERTVTPDMYQDENTAAQGVSTYQLSPLVETDKMKLDVTPSSTLNTFASIDSETHKYLENYFTQVANQHAAGSASPVLVNQHGYQRCSERGDRVDGSSEPTQELLPASRYERIQVSYEELFDSNSQEENDYRDVQFKCDTNNILVTKPLLSNDNYKSKGIEGKCSAITRAKDECAINCKVRPAVGKDVEDHGNLNEYMEIAMNMSDNFSPLPTRCHGVETGRATSTPVEARASAAASPNAVDGSSQDQFDESLTFSMIENMLSNDKDSRRLSGAVKDSRRLPALKDNERLSVVVKDSKRLSGAVKDRWQLSAVMESRQQPLAEGALKAETESRSTSDEVGGMEWTSERFLKINKSTEELFDNLAGFNANTPRKPPPKEGSSAKKMDKKLGEIQPDLTAKPTFCEDGRKDAVQFRKRRSQDNTSSSDGKQVKLSPSDDCNNLSVNKSDASDNIPPSPVESAVTPGRRATPKHGLNTPRGRNVNTPVTRSCRKRVHNETPSIKSNQMKSLEVKSQVKQKHIPTARHLLKTPCDAGTSTGSASVLVDAKSFAIIDVTGDVRLFDNFIDEWKSQKSYAFCIACEQKQQDIVSGIGGKFRKDQSKPCETAQLMFGDQVLVGLSVCWGNCDAYYIDLTQGGATGDPDDSLAAPELDSTLTVDYRLGCIKRVLELDGTAHGGNVVKAAFDVKEQYKALASGCGIVLASTCQDPKVASWMMDPGAREMNLHSMVLRHTPPLVELLEELGGGHGLSSSGLSVRNTVSGRIRSTVESVLVYHLMGALNLKLGEEGYTHSFQQVEMPSIMLLGKMELNGMGFSQTECDSQQSLMQAKLSALEQEAYAIVGHPFSLSSPDDISQVLFVELRLPPTGDPSAPLQTKTLGPAKRGRRRQQFSTSKDILEKLKKLHKLPAVILEWRRITSALTKNVFPFQREKIYSDRLDMHRIHGYSWTHTQTGRVTMSEPNLQNIPRDFEIQMPGTIGESPPAGVVGVPNQNRKRRCSSHHKVAQQLACIDHKAPSVAVSMRHAFVPFTGGVILAADYSQLELRIIAHLSRDKKLINILNGGGDVFKMIAAQWKLCTPDEISAKDRQQAKQVCYGMIYGIGAKALADQLEVHEQDAAAFMESFKDRYKGMKSYIKTTVDQCRKDGYVTTVLGRKRFLPAINDENPFAKAQAERQAVNTTIQGSAADLVKKAMVDIDAILAKHYPDTVRTHRHKHESTRSTRKQSHRVKLRGAYFILQLHDELIYEVSKGDVSEVARCIKHGMETAMEISVKLPVKVKVGPSWGQLTDFDC